jgi:Siderophore-interacting FAD-binding domain
MEQRTHRVRHNSRRRTVAVLEKRHVTPRMLRIVLGGEDFEDFTTQSADDHIKLYVPGEGGDLAARDFTPRHFDAEAKKLTIDIALHSAGPAIRWADQVQAGDVVEISEPRGSFMIADDFNWWLLIGDETALPSIGRRVEGLAEGRSRHHTRGSRGCGRGTGDQYASRSPGSLGSSSSWRGNQSATVGGCAEDDQTVTRRRFRLDCGGGQPRPWPGGARPGQQPGRRVGEPTNEAWQDQTVGFYYVVVDAMSKAGFTPDEIGRIGGGNFLRVFAEVVKKWPRSGRWQCSRNRNVA